MAKVKLNSNGFQSLRKAAGAEPNPIRHRRSEKGTGTVRLVNVMSLDEMLEASKMIEMGIKGEKISKAKSDRARKYVERVLVLNERTSTRPFAEKMVRSLNAQILRTNRKTTNTIQSKRLYHELMAEK